MCIFVMLTLLSANYFSVHIFGIGTITNQNCSFSRPVRLILDLDTNMALLGKRQPTIIPYEVMQFTLLRGNECKETERVLMKSQI